MAQASDYEAQLREVARLVTERCAPGHPWSLVWQSRSGPPTVPWLEPDIGDALAALAAGGTRSVVVAPIGFISDHMEVVFDLDVVAAERAAALGLRFVASGDSGSGARVRGDDPRTRRGTARSGSPAARSPLGPARRVRPECARRLSAPRLGAERCDHPPSTSTFSLAFCVGGDRGVAVGFERGNT